VEKSSKRVENLDFQEWLKNLHHAKVEDFLPTIHDKSIDLVYTDPPYGIDLNATTDTEAYECYDDVPEEIESLVLWCIGEYYRVLKDDTFCVVWTSNQLYRPLYDRAKEVGFGVAPTPLYWIKTGHSGKAKNPEKTLGSAAEIALYCWKGDPVLREKGGQNVFPFPTVRKNRIHIAQKPESLICKHLDIFSDPGYLVLDTFSGSGAIMRATILSKRLFKGCEKDEANYYSSLTYTQEYFEGKDDDENKA
jgi:DNA modification methylase